MIRRSVNLLENKPEILPSQFSRASEPELWDLVDLAMDGLTPDN